MQDSKLVLCKAFSLTTCHRFSVFYVIHLRPNRQPSLVHGQSSIPCHQIIPWKWRIFCCHLQVATLALQNCLIL